MKKRNIMVTSSIAVALFISSYTSTQAASYTLLKSRLYEETQSITEDVPIDDLSVSAGDYREDHGLDPTFQNSLIQQGFSPAQIQKIFTSASLKNDYDKLPLSE